jgi:hypothetical protein
MQSLLQGDEFRKRWSLFKLNQYIKITPFMLLALGKRAEEPNIADIIFFTKLRQMCAEILNDLIPRWLMADFYSLRNEPSFSRGLSWKLYNFKVCKDWLFANFCG